MTDAAQLARSKENTLSFSFALAHAGHSDTIPLAILFKLKKVLSLMALAR